MADLSTGFPAGTGAVAPGDGIGFQLGWTISKPGRLSGDAQGTLCDGGTPDPAVLLGALE